MMKLLSLILILSTMLSAYSTVAPSMENTPLTMSASINDTINADSMPVFRHDKLHGFKSSEFEIRADSVADFSNVAKYGKRCEWNYILQSRDTLIEHRGTDWCRYEVRKDSIMLNHVESSREKRDFSLLLTPGLGSSDTIPYRSLTRRDRSFNYLDIGVAVLRTPISGVSVILNDCDTVKECVMYEMVIDFLRYKGTESDSIALPLKRIIETERIWCIPGLLQPYALIHNTVSIISSQDTIQNSYAVCFPRDLNGESIDIHNVELKKNSGQYEKSAVLSPSLSVDIKDRSVEVNSYWPFELSVSDLSGKVHIYRKYDTSTGTVNLDHLQGGEYVVWVKSGEEVFSQTIILKP